MLVERRQRADVFGRAQQEAVDGPAALAVAGGKLLDQPASRFEPREVIVEDIEKDGVRKHAEDLREPRVAPASEDRCAFRGRRGSRRDGER